ncbi:MAG: molybdate transport system ATP-binding protein [Oceanicoccus sp.]|jgi:molybdate transport system ATP-binding protein
MSIAFELDLVREKFSLALKTELPSSGFSAIYGSSGAGKTTLLRWIAGLEKNTEGTLSFNNENWQDGAYHLPTQERKIAYVFQDARLFPHLNVARNLEYAYRRRFNNDGPSIENVCDWFELWPLLQSSTTNLSGGEKQRTALARALLSSPQLILMDEPLGSLDSVSKERILSLLENIHQHFSAPIIYVSHDIEEVSRLAEHLLILDNGKINAQGSLIELSSRTDLSLNHEEHASSIIDAIIHSHDKKYHLTELTINKQLPLFITSINSAAGNKVRVRIPARDVSITLERNNNSSILNILPATIDAIEQTSNARMLVRVKIAEQFLLVRITHKSADRLQLTVGKTVYAQIKTVALLSEKNLLIDDSHVQIKL